MKVRRRIYDSKTGQTKIVTEDVTLVSANAKTVMVRLANGDEIKRKNIDIVEK